MKQKTFILFVLLFLLSACATPSTPVTPDVDSIVTSTLQAMTAVAEPQMNQNTVSFNNITFSIPPSMNINVSPVVSTNTEYPFIYPSEDPMPEHVRFEFGNYPVTSYPQNSNEILVFKASEYAAFNPSLQETVNALLAKQDSASPFPEALVDSNFFAQASPIRFQNGHGARYLDQVLTGIAPINNQELFYYFQGITDNGAYFISARLHTSASFLVSNGQQNSPTPPDGIPFNWDPSTGFDPAAYFTGIEQKLNDTPSDDFTPSLAVLDQLIQSIQVTTP